MSKRISQQEFIERVVSCTKNVEIIGQYTKSSERITVKCTKCGNIWNPIASALLQGHGCPKCARKYVVENRKGLYRKKTHEEFVKEINDSLPSIVILGTYTKSADKIKCKCSVCGNMWAPTANSLLSGHGCPCCAREHVVTTRRGAAKRKTNEEFIIELNKVNSDIFPISSYVNDATKIEVKCLRCGHKWKVKPNHILRGHGCPRCIASSTSFFEQVVFEALKSVLGENEVVNRDQQTIGKELDIYIPSKKMAIEPGAWHWHKNRVDEAIEKQLECRKKGIRLLIIYDACHDSLPPLEDRWVVNMDLSLPSSVKHARRIVCDIFKEININSSITDSKWNEIISNASESAKRITNEKFLKEVKIKNPEIRIIGDYINRNTPIEAICVCGKTWYPSPQRILQGSLFGSCGNKRAWELRKNNCSKNESQTDK